MNMLFIYPKCDRCGAFITDLEIEEFPLKSELLIPVKRFSPSACPNCYLPINKVEIDHARHTIIVKES